MSDCIHIQDILVDWNVAKVLYDVVYRFTFFSYPLASNSGRPDGSLW